MKKKSVWKNWTNEILDFDIMKWKLTLQGGTHGLSMNALWQVIVKI